MVARMEKGRTIGSEVMAARKLGGLSKAADYIQARFADYRKKATLEQQTTLLEVATHAANLERQTKTKIEAVLHPEKRYRLLPGASKNEASADHGGISQDEVLCADDQQLYGVFDGMGGYGSGDKASKDAARVVKAALDSLSRDASQTDIALALKLAFKQAGQAIYDADYNQGVFDDRKGGTVGVVAKIHTAANGKRTAIIAHAGDARAYVRKKSGRLIPLTQDHGLLSHYVEFGEITAARARKLNEKFSNVTNPEVELDDSNVVVEGLTELDLYKKGNIVTSTVDKDTEPEITEYELEDGDQLLLTSDGIHDLVPDTHISKAFAASSSSTETVDRLFELSKSGIRIGPGRKTDDDRSALVVSLEDVLAPEIERVKHAYLQAAANGEFLPVPLDVIAREAFALVLQIDRDWMERRVRLQFRDQAPSSVEAAGWRVVGLHNVMNDVRAGAEPITVTTTKVASEPAQSVDPVNAIRSERLTMNYHDFSRRVLQERKIMALLGTGFVPRDADEAIRQLDYLDTGAITVEQGLVDTLTELVKLMAGRELDVPALAASMQVEQIARKLGISKEAVIETVQAQHAALLHQAAQQEKAGRSIKKALAKGAGYLAAGVGLSMAGLAPAGVMALVAGAKVYDAYTSVGKQTADRKAIEASLLADLTTSRDAYAALADADRAANKATGLYKTVLENLAAGLAQRKEEQLRGVQLDVGEVESNYYERLVTDHLSTELAAKNDAINQYNVAVRAGASAEELERLHKVMLEKQTIFNQRAEPYRRMAEAQGSLARIDHETAHLEAETKQSVTGGFTTSWFERNPRIAAILGMRAETVSEKLASVAFFTAMGVAAREHISIRIAVSAFAGARLGDTLFTLAERKLSGEASLLTTIALKDINPRNARTAKAQLDELASTAAKTREKLLDQDFKRRKPKEYRDLQTTLHVYEQLTLVTNAQLAIYRMDEQEYNRLATPFKTELKKVFKMTLRLVAIGEGAFFGSLIGAQLAQLAMARVEQQLDQDVPTAPPEVVVPPDAVTPAPVVPDASVVAPPVAPDVLAGEPVVPDLPVVLPEAVPSGSGAITPPPEVSPAPIAGTAEQLSHKVGENKSLWHGLRHQGSNAEIAAGLNKTEVVLNGKTVSMMETGVRDADTVSPNLGADGKVHLYDVRDGHQIGDDEMGKYLYIMKEGPGGHGTGSAVERVADLPEPSPEPVFRTPDLGHDNSSSYVAEGLRDYVHTHLDYTYLSGLNDAVLADQPELRHIADQLTEQYQAAVLRPAIEPVAASLGGGGGVVPEPIPSAATDTAFSSLEPGADYVGVTGRLNAEGMQALTLGEHITETGEVQDFEHFKQDILKLLDLDQKRDGIRTANHLVFENRGGVLCVDVAGGPKEHHPVTPELYAALMQHYQDVVNKPGYNGRFDQDEFAAVLKVALEKAK